MPVTAAILSNAATRMAAAVAYNNEAAAGASSCLSDQQVADKVILCGAESHMLGSVLEDTRRRFTKPVSPQVQSLPQGLLDAISQVLVACEMTTSITTRNLEELQSGLPQDTTHHHLSLLSSAASNMHNQASMLSLLLRTIDSPSAEYIHAVLRSSRSELDSLKFEAASIQAESAREAMSLSRMTPAFVPYTLPASQPPAGPLPLPPGRRPVSASSHPVHSRAVSTATSDSFAGSNSDASSYLQPDATSSEAGTAKDVVLRYDGEKEVVPTEKEAVLAKCEDRRLYRSRYPTTGSLDLKAVQRKTLVPLIGISAVYPSMTRIQACGPQGMTYGALAMSNRDFNLAGLSHIMTTTLMAVFVSRGDFTWDDPITQALPSMRLHVHETNAHTTIGMIGGHASGLTQSLESLKDEGLWSVLKDSKTASLQARRAIVATYLSQPPPITPGSDSVPRHVNGMIIALILEEFTGKAFDELIRTQLFQPLDMMSATVGVKIHNNPGALWLRQAESGHAIGFTKPGSGGAAHFGSTLGGLPYIGPGAIAALYPGAGMACTLGDLVKFLVFHIDGASRHRTPILVPADFELLHSPVPGLFSTFGGWFEQDTGAKHSSVTGKRLLSHSTGAGFTVRCEIAPDAHAGFACIVNGSGAEASTAAATGLDLCFEELMPTYPSSSSSSSIKARGMFSQVRRWSKTSSSS